MFPYTKFLGAGAAFFYPGSGSSPKKGTAMGYGHTSQDRSVPDKGLMQQNIVSLSVGNSKGQLDALLPKK